MYYDLVLREKGLVFSSLKGLIRSYFQSPKKRGHPGETPIGNFMGCENLTKSHELL